MRCWFKPEQVAGSWEYCGIEQSIAELKGLWKKHNGFDGVIGFSQVWLLQFDRKQTLHFQIAAVGLLLSLLDCCCCQFVAVIVRFMLSLWACCCW